MSHAFLPPLFLYTLLCFPWSLSRKVSSLTLRCTTQWRFPCTSYSTLIASAHKEPATQFRTSQVYIAPSTFPMPFPYQQSHSSHPAEEKQIHNTQTQLPQPQPTTTKNDENASLPRHEEENLWTTRQLPSWSRSSHRILRHAPDSLQEHRRGQIL